MITATEWEFIHLKSEEINLTLVDFNLVITLRKDFILTLYRHHTEALTKRGGILLSKGNADKSMEDAEIEIEDLNSNLFSPELRYQVESLRLHLIDAHELLDDVFRALGNTKTK